jgi:hypothetical protein
VTLLRRSACAVAPFLVIIVILAVAVCSCSSSTGGPSSSLAGQYIGYSWQGEVDGTSLQDSNQYIETILHLDQNGLIADASMRFFVKKDGYWILRQSGNAYVNVNFSVDPSPAVPGENYKAGSSMFTVYTADMMSFYAVAVSSSGVTAVALVDPVTRYLFEMKLPPGYDYSSSVGELTIGSGKLVPTTRTSGAGYLKPIEWESLSDRNIFNIEVWSHVINSTGVLKGLNASSSVQEFLEALGVVFADGRPQPMEIRYGYFGLGGWAGNYSAVESFLIGQDANKRTSLVDWSIPRYAGAINDKNQFGIDAVSGATKTAQDSIDTISGATVRMSRESTSYQRALVQAGILDESDVIIGRF